MFFFSLLAVHEEKSRYDREQMKILFYRLSMFSKFPFLYDIQNVSRIKQMPAIYSQTEAPFDMQKTLSLKAVKRYVAS